MMVFPDSLVERQFFDTLRRENIVPTEDLLPLDGSGEIVRFRTVNDKPYETSGAYYFHADGFPNWGVMEFGRHTGMVQDTFRFDRLDSREQDIMRAANPEDTAEWRARMEQTEKEGKEKEKVKSKKVNGQGKSRSDEQGKSRSDEQGKSRSAAGRLLALRDVVRRAPVVMGGARLRGYLWERFYLRGVDRYIENITGFAQWSIAGQTHPVAANALRQGRTDSLLIPLSHVETGAFMGVQWIAGQPETDGHYARGFMKGTELTGACYEIPLTGNRDDEAVYVCEGVCTGLAIKALLHCDLYGGFRYRRGPVFCCLTTANMRTVCNGLRHRYGTERSIIIMSDHDGATAAKRGYNPGHEAAVDCVNAGLADVELPAEMIGRSGENTDYYDVFIERWAEV